MDAPDANRFDPSDSPFTGDDRETKFGPASPEAQASPDSNPASSAGLKGLNRIGKYEVRGELGSGGMGVVLRAHDPILNRLVAIKVLRAPGFGSGEQLARFNLEARSTARLQHPAIVSLHEVGNHEDMPFLVMDLIEGESLQSALTRAPLPPRRAAEITKVIADGLSHAHAHGIIHRDMKPHNILIDEAGRAFLTDFGLALDTTLRQQLTATGELLGTPAYMAPEQVDSEWGLICETTDVYGLGAVLYSSLTGEQPHNATTPMALLRKVLFNEVTPPRQLNPAIHPDLETITLRCMEKMPLERYATAAEVNAELNRFLQGEAIVARPLTHSQRWWRWTRRHRALSITMALLAAALLTIAFTMVKQNRDLAEQAEAVRREESLRTLAASRSEASKARRLFTELNVAADDNPGTHDDEATGRGLGALEANLRLVSLLDDATDTLAAEELQRVKETSAMTALSLARLAQGSGQWAVAQNALDRALPLGVRTEEMAAAQTSLDQARTRVARERRETVHAVISAARAGDLARQPQQRSASAFRGNYDAALLRLVGLDHTDTTKILTDALGTVTQRLLKANQQMIRIALEKHADTNEIPSLIEASNKWLTNPRGIRPGSDTARAAAKVEEIVLLNLGEHLGRFGRSNPDDWKLGMPFGLQNNQSTTLDIGDIQLAKLCCETLSYSKPSDTAADGLANYLQAEWSLSRAIHAAKALLRQRGDAAIEELHFASERLRDGGQITSLLRQHNDSSIGAERYDDIVQDAVMMLFRRELEAATLAINRALKQEPDAPGALAVQGMVGILQNQASGVQELEKAIQLEPTDPVVMICHAAYLYEIGRANSHSGHIAEAENFLVKALELATDIIAELDYHIPSQLLRGRVRFEQGLIEQDLKGDRGKAFSYWAGAIEAYSYALLLDPHCEIAFSERGMTYKRRGNFLAAHEDYSQALLIDPTDAETWSNRGNVRYETGNFDGAVSDHSEAIKRRPDLHRSWVNRGNAYYLKRRYPEAVSDLDRALVLDPNDAATFQNKAQVLLDMADAAADGKAAHHLRMRALEDAERGLDLRPQSPVSFYVMALCMRALNRPAEAKSALEQLLKLEPDVWLFKRAREMLAQLDG